MNPRQPVPDALLRLAAEQSGALSLEQATGLGLSRYVVDRLCRQGWWLRLARGIYLTTPQSSDWTALAWAGILAGGTDARLDAAASGFDYGLVSTAPEPIGILVPYGRSARRSGPWRLQRERPGVRPTKTRGSLPKLDVETTVLDPCHRGTEAEVVGFVSTAVQRGLTTPARLGAALDHRGRLRHRRVIAGMVLDVAEGAQSPLEVAYLRDVERAHGLPTGRRQKSRLGLRYVTDVGHDDYRLLIELDGRDGHEGTGRFRDMQRDNLFAFAEWMTLRYGWYDVTVFPCLAAWQVAAVLQARGWPGLPTRCPRCQAVPEEELAGNPLATW